MSKAQTTTKIETAEIVTAPVTTNAKVTKSGTTRTGLIFKKSKVVTVPVLKLMPDAPVYVMVDKAMEISKQIDNKQASTETPGKKKMEPATIMHCTNLDGDDECILIVGKVLESVFNETYPEQTYVGKTFEIVNHGKRGDKAYNTYSVTEIEVESN